MEWNLLIAVVSAAFLVHLRGAYLFAQKQKIVAIRLHSYARYWYSYIVDNSDFFNIYYIGKKWNEEIEDLINRNGNVEEYIDIREEKRKVCKEIENKIKEIDDGLNQQLKDNLEKYIGYFETSNFLNHWTLFNQNIFEGKTFITDEDACYLGETSGPLCIEMKMNFIKGIDKLFAIIARYLNDRENFSFREEANELSESIWYIILASKNFDTLRKYLEELMKENILSLTRRNIIPTNR